MQLRKTSPTKNSSKKLPRNSTGSGVPACPDHLDKDLIWTLLDAEQSIGAALTESKAILPAAAVAGYYFAHPEARYLASDLFKTTN